MRKLIPVLALVLGTAACAGDAAAPADDSSTEQLQEMALLGFSAMQVGDASDGLMGRLAQLPSDLALTAEQRSRINGLIEAFVAATTADREALTAVMKAAADARKAGGTPEEIRAILATGAPIRVRLQLAGRALHGAIVAVLTPAQRAWLTGRTPPVPGPCSTVTEAQRNEISALRAQYEQNNAADIALVRSAHDRAAAAKQAGATPEQIRAILAEARQAMQRLVLARAALIQAIGNVLTPEQRAAGCFIGK